ncbi:MAG: hypothetical protein HN732_18145 [Rhodospirillaceae bacterium]|nr:hypothetical protein [Rhodospirillaceae bacterium]
MAELIKAPAAALSASVVADRLATASAMTDIIPVQRDTAVTVAATAFSSSAFVAAMAEVEIIITAIATGKANFIII